MSRVVVVVGGEFGSEAKGHATAQLVAAATEKDRGVVNIRVAGPNAGHTVYDRENRRYAFRQVPVGAVLGTLDNQITSIIAAGSEIDLEVLVSELDLLVADGHIFHLDIDENATLIEYRHKAEEAGVGLVDRIGSTGKGIGAARADRLMRGARRLKDSPEALERLLPYHDMGRVCVLDTAQGLHDALAFENMEVIIEGTQGYGLGLHTGYYPQVTSSDCRAIDFLAMAGISPWHVGIASTSVLVVARVFPIRVAGNSGPLKDETSWEELGLEEERTTVTQKVRRVGEWDGELVAEAVRANGGNGGTSNPFAGLMGDPVGIALTMVDQSVPGAYGATNLEDLGDADRAQVQSWIDQVQDEAGAPVVMIGTSESTVIWL